MNKKLVGIPFIALSLILAMLPPQASAASFQVSQTYWGTATSPIEAGPGDKSVAFNVVVQNIGSQAFSGLDATLFLQYPFSNVTGGGRALGFYSGSVQVGQTATLQFQVSVNDAAAVGSYLLVMNLNYGMKLSLGESLFVPVLLLGRVELKTSIDPPSISPGSKTTLMITLRNRGTGYATKVSATFSLPAGLSIEGDNQRFYSSIAPNESKAIALSVYAQPSLAGSSLQIGASLTYNDAYGVSRVLNQVLGLTVTPTVDIPFTLTIEGGELHPGMPNDVRLSIRNNHEKPVSFVKALLTFSSSAGSPPLIVLGDNLWFFRSIDPLESTTFNTKLMVPLEAAGENYQPTLSLSYLDPFNVTRTENHLFGVRVLTAPRNILLASVDQGILRAGSVNEPKITVSNSGMATIRSITINFLIPTAPSASTAASSVVLTEGSQWYYDLLLPDHNLTFSPKIFATLGSIDTSYQVQLSISYTDENGISRVETRSLGFAIKGLANFEVRDILLTPRAAYPGANITITGDLLNMGSVRALYTTVIVKTSPYFEQPRDGTSYIGEVSTNVLTPFSLSSRVRRTVTNGTYLLTLQFNYQNDYGDKYSYEKVFNIVVGSFIPPAPSQSPQQQQNIVIQYAPYWVTLVVAVFVVLIYRRRKRRQK